MITVNDLIRNLTNMVLENNKIGELPIMFGEVDYENTQMEYYNYENFKAIRLAKMNKSDDNYFSDLVGFYDKDNPKSIPLDEVNAVII